MWKIIFEYGEFMPVVAEKEKTNKVKNQIINNFNLLTWQQQSEVASEINRMIRMKRIKDLEDSINSNGMTMEEIVAITKEVRNAEDKNNAQK